MKKNINHMKWILFFLPLVFAVGIIHADECEGDECPTNITVASRAISAEKRAELALNRELQPQDELLDDEEFDGEELAAKGSLFKDFYQLHYAAFHRPVAIAVDGSSLELEDGSIWSLKSSLDMVTALFWTKKDSLVIEQWDYSGLEYKILNQTRDEYVIASPILGPIFDGIHTHWIKSIDSFGTVKLEDGSEWDAFSKSDLALWQPNDTVFLGAYRSGASYNTILINVNLLDYARVKLNWKR